jgi:hypothetical protein
MFYYCASDNKKYFMDFMEDYISVKEYAILKKKSLNWAYKQVYAKRVPFIKKYGVLLILKQKK